MLSMLQDSQVAPAWLRLKFARQEPVSLADAFFEGADILDDGETEDSAAADFMCSSPSRIRSEVRLPLSPAWANDASAASAVIAARGRVRAGEQLTEPASKRRNGSMRSPCRLAEAELDAGIEMEQEIDASCAVLGLTGLPKVDALLSPPRRGARLRPPALSPQPSRGTATAAFQSPSKMRGAPEHSRGILGQLQDQQEREEDALQRLVTPRKQLHSLGEEAPGSGGVMQALLQQEAMEASALERAVTPKRQHWAAHTPPGSGRRAALEPGTAEAAPGGDRNATPGLMGPGKQHQSTLQQLLSPRRPHAPPESKSAPGSESRRMQGLLSTADKDAMPAQRTLSPGKRQQASQPGKDNDSRSTLSYGKTSTQTIIQNWAVLDRDTWRLLQVVGPGMCSSSGMQHRSCTQLGPACSGKLVWRIMAEGGVHDCMSLAFLLGEYSRGLQLDSVWCAGLLLKAEQFPHMGPYGRFLQEDYLVLCRRSEGGTGDQDMRECSDSDAADEDEEEDEGDHEEAAFHSLRHVKPFAREACRALDAAEAAAAAGGGRHRSSLAAALRR